MKGTAEDGYCSPRSIGLWALKGLAGSGLFELMRCGGASVRLAGFPMPRDFLGVREVARHVLTTFWWQICR
ncbi:unnamed protein product [Prunus armeniaca]|uniref:Uncharacterized protein n=1 Tax=Prunus armeniaca TaxID=36596 RepID=A0A6J5X0X9_PRUAR|nr:unnamed protein product [Prunus armeniaca]